MSRSSNSRGAGVSLRRASLGANAGDAARGASGESSPSVPELPGFDPDDIDPDELRDFMAADWVEVKADPGFRERLREKLWKQIRSSLPESDDD